MNTESATLILKAINRRVRKADLMGCQTEYQAYGIDYATWCVTYPHLASVFVRAAEIITKRKNRRFMPIWLNKRNK